MKYIFLTAILITGCSMPKGTPVTNTSTIDCINEPAEQASVRIRNQIEACYSWHPSHIADKVISVVSRTKQGNDYHVEVNIEKTNETTIDTTSLNDKYASSMTTEHTEKAKDFKIILQPLKSPTADCKTDYILSTNTFIYNKQRDMVKEIVTNKNFACKNKGDYL